MSDTSSPSVHIHPISPSSSFSDSSRGSGLHSEPTSDEEPDLGAFTTVLREWTHLQPPPRIPIQIRSATSSTTPTFQPSIVGSESPSNRSANSHIAENSAISSFTRPPSSSAQPEGSTVWAHPPIASYLYSGTPSNDNDEGESNQSVGAEEEYTPNSIVSAALTVEIASETDFEQSNGQTAPSPYPYPSDSGISLPLTLESNNNRLNSRENAHHEEEIDTSETSKGRTFQASQPGTSVQLLSQVRPTSTEDLSTVAVATTNLSTFVSDSPPTFSLNRSRNPEPPRRTVSDSSFTTSGSTSSSNLSLLSYQISETLSEPNSEGESSSNAYLSSNIVSTFLDLKTQNSIATSHSESANSFSTQRPQQLSQHSFPPIPITQSSTISSTGSPLPNPHSPPSTPEPDVSVPVNNTRRPMLRSNAWRQDIIVYDLGTPDQPPSETLLYDPQSNIRPEFRPVVDEDEDEDDIRVERYARIGESTEATQSGHSSLSSYARNAPPSATRTAYNQLAGSMRARDRHELYNEDEDEENPLPTPYSRPHGSAPRVIGPSLTPRGIPLAPPQPQHGTHTTISVTANSVVQPLGYSTQSLLPNTKLNTLQQLPLQNIATAPLQYHFQTNQSNSNLYNTSPPTPPDLQPNIQQSSSSVYTPRAPPSAPYLTPPDVSTFSSQYSPPQRPSPPDATINNAHGYPYSLLGLHALPTLIPSRGTSTLPSASSIDSDTGTSTSRFPTFSDLSDDNSTIYGDAPRAHVETDSIVLEQAVPSLGFLDGVLNFIAVERERVRHNTVREAAVSTVMLEINDIGSGEDGEAVGNEGPTEAVEGEEDWKHVIGDEVDQPKRKRRRKRPTKAHALTALNQVSDISERVDIQNPLPPTTGEPHIVIHPAATPLTPASSPKKKRVKSGVPSISASASASVISLSHSGEGPKTPTTARIRDKEFLIAPPVSRSASTSRKQDATAVTILRRPERSDDDGGDSDFDGGKTPTKLDNLEAGRFLSTESSGSPIYLLGKKGKRVGRREREREKERHDGLKLDVREDENLEAGIEGSVYSLGQENDVNDLHGKEGDQGEDNDSLSNLSLLKPPKRRRERSRKRKTRDTTYMHALAGITGTYNNTPGTPGYEHEDTPPSDLVHERGPLENIEEYDLLESHLNDGSAGPEKRKRTRSKRMKHTQSIPDLAVDADTLNAWPAPAAYSQSEFTIPSSASKPQKSRVKAVDLMPGEDLEIDRNQLQNYLIASGSSIVLMNTRPEKIQPPPDSKRGRLITLARQLRDLFPEQREDLGRVISRLEKQGAKVKVNKYAEDGPEAASKPVPIPSPMRNRTRKGHVRSETDIVAMGGEDFDFDLDQPYDDNDIGEGLDNVPEIELDEEIDPRGRPPRRGDVLVHVFIDHSNILIGLLSHLKRTQSYRKNAANKARSRPLPAIISKAGAVNKIGDQADSVTSAFAPTSSQPFSDTAIPLPSFATASRSFPTTSVLSDHMKSKDTDNIIGETTAPLERQTNSDGYEFATADDDSGGRDDLISFTKEKKYPRHLWHAALALILERGRPVTRRVVVTSSPLYQPMDAIERLGYELRVFIRVPDFGDGLDRERYKDKDKNPLPKSSGGTKSAQSSPVNTASMSGSPATTKKSRSIGHARRPSGNASAESGSGGGSANTMGTGSFNLFYGTPNNSTPQGKVKFREQGVDELLQLKLHQALAATDQVPEGSTIVLATGDGNVGQFNEDGFLGPVRTALRRGWRVELYAWEDGLSRAWKREFGDGSEWGRSGLFRVIGMEQFAYGLVEALQ